MKYAAVGSCIYCGSTSGKLGDEHIIPLSLNGALILPEASCKVCEAITHRYEHTVAREIFGKFRMRYNVKTRHKKKRPTHIPIGTQLPDGAAGTCLVPVAEHPVMLFVYKFAEPTILRCFPPDVEDFKWVPISIFSKQELDDFVKTHHWDRKAKFRAVPVEFARMLAKIAYSYSVAELGLGSFYPSPLLIDIVLNRSSNVSYVVGGDWDIPPPDPRGFHLLQMTCKVAGKGASIIIEIRLFPAFETPHYRVVVGEFDFRVPEHVAAFNVKMRDVETIEPMPPNPAINPDLAHEAAQGRLP